MKLRNKSGLIAAIAGLAAVSMLSVGFAAWVLTATDTSQVGGSIQVETVNGDDIYLISNPSVSGNFKFGTPTSEELAGYTGLQDPAWLTFDDSGTEVLTVTISCDVTNVTSQALAEAHVEISSFTASAGYDAALGHGYVAALPSAASLTPTYSGGHVTFTITLQWGSAFGGKNPYEYYNSQVKSNALVTEAQTKLNGLVTDLTSVTYSVTIATK